MKKFILFILFILFLLTCAEKACMHNYINNVYIMEYFSYLRRSLSSVHSNCRIIDKIEKMNRI